MENIGNVIYSFGEETGSLKAKWCHSDYGCGTGFATGGQSDSFEGNYDIQYFDSNGKLVVTLKLEIIDKQGCYHLIWRNNGAISAKGIGIATSNVLSVGYRDV